MPPELSGTSLLRWREGVKTPDPESQAGPNTDCLSAGKSQYEGTSGSVTNFNKHLAIVLRYLTIIKALKFSLTEMIFCEICLPVQTVQVNAWIDISCQDQSFGTWKGFC